MTYRCNCCKYANCSACVGDEGVVESFEDVMVRVHNNLSNLGDEELMGRINQNRDYFPPDIRMCTDSTAKELILTKDSTALGYKTPITKITGKVCPICGSTSIETNYETRVMQPMYAGFVSVDQICDRCNSCGEEGDFAGMNDAAIENATDEITTQRAILSLDKLEELGFKPTWIERCLGLNIGHIKKCKENNFFPRDTYVLLRLLEYQPDLLYVAKDGYAPLTITNTEGRPYVFDGVTND